MGTSLTKHNASTLLPCLVVVLCFMQFGETSFPDLPINQQSSFNTAVYNHRAIIPIGNDKPRWDYAKSIIAQNLDIYEGQIKEAAKQNVKMIVFPEDGLFGLSFSRTDIYNYLEYVPDPSEDKINPCDDFDDPDNRPIQVRMSCAAREYSMWITVNMGDIQNCTQLIDPDCPSDGRYQYNTNIVFNDKGDLVARYHKKNLFYEFQFDMPTEVQNSYFETPYGRMGMFICFDILFKSPAVDLVEEFDIKHALFPTAWRSIIPSMSGLGFHESYAIRFGVNLLSAEYHFPEGGWIGSAVYRGALGANEFYNDYSFMSPGKLLITETPIEPVKPRSDNVNVIIVNTKQDNFTSIMEKNLYTWLILEEEEGELYLRDQDTQCYLKYKMKMDNKNDLFAFGIFEGQHYDYLNSYIQVCALVRCANLDKSTCGDPTRETHTVFEELSLSGSFSVDYIFPALLVERGDIDKASWTFTLDNGNNAGQINASEMDKPLLSAILYTRDYSRDNNTGFERPPVAKEDSPQTFNDYIKHQYNSKTDVNEEQASETQRKENENKPKFSLLWVWLLFGIVGSTFIVVLLGYLWKRNPRNGYINLCGVKDSGP